MFNHKNEIQDERIIHQTQKVVSNAGIITLILLFISIFIKSVVLDMAFKYFATELIIMGIGGLYIIIQSMLDGNLDMGFKGRNARTNIARTLTFSLLGGVIFGCGIGFINYYRYTFNASMLPLIILPLIIEFSLLIFGACWVVDFISRKRNLKNEEKLEASDD